MAKGPKPPRHSGDAWGKYIDEQQYREGMDNAAIIDNAMSARCPCCGDDDAPESLKKNGGRCDVCTEIDCDPRNCAVKGNGSAPLRRR